jgi:AAA15 family ATPase/GTPase
MKKIDKIRIKNFKAFPELQEFDLQRKNLLVYGNNGSGKSSLYWALYTLLQSSEKTVERVNDYFSEYDGNNESTFQSLRNIFSAESESYVEIVLQGELPIRISKGHISDVQNASVKEANKASDFINYKLLHNFYNSTHKNQLNLWDVFNRDVFPYFLHSKKSFTERLDYLHDNLPKQTNNYHKFYPRTSNKYKQYKKNISEFNRELTTLIKQIDIQANIVLKNKFGIDDINITLDYSKELNWDKNNDRKFSKPEIKLTIKVKRNGNFITYHRPQSFLNEAALTRIAISIRLGALFTRLATSEWKILVLDDMLISLDISNRMLVSKIILEDEDLKDFQKIILTHDRGFFDILKSKTDNSEWKYLKFTKNEQKIDSKPEIKVDETDLEKAKDFFEKNEFEVCANYLRKEAEKIIKNYLNKELTTKFETLSNLIGQAKNKIKSERLARFNKLFEHNDLPLEKIKDDFEHDTTLTPEIRGKLNTLKTHLFNFLISENSQEDKIIKLLSELETIKDGILNPASHATSTPLYPQELKDAIEVIRKLHSLLNPPATTS